MHISNYNPSTGPTGVVTKGPSQRMYGSPCGKTIKARDLIFCVYRKNITPFRKRQHTWIRHKEANFIMADDLVNWRLLLGLFLFGLNQFLVIFFIKTAGLVDRVSCRAGEKSAPIRREVRARADMQDFPTGTYSNPLDEKQDILKRADKTWNRLQNDLHEKGLEKFFRNHRKTYKHDVARQNFEHSPDDRVADIAGKTGFDHSKIGLFKHKEEAMRKHPSLQKIISKT
ncbi:Hypp5301 [Branchiostoma lanceolatum]|uniref:Hypp5301 protein n=1 Tax=Branchiostoma lanceolatum TaxID=7740 RepID=A0A8K0AI43_BRALA|nr:Hypp5301 [Branchiostoma lanceolatum]